MNLSALVPLSLLNYPGKLCATLFFGVCNLRCPYCHNAPLVTGELQPLELDEVLNFLKKRQGKLDGVCLSGGEPLAEPCVEAELLPFVQSLKAMNYQVKLDTNGTHPKKLDTLLPLLDYVAMDIKNSPKKYALTCGVSSVDMQAISESISLILNHAKDYEFRTTIVEPLHTLGDVRAMLKLITGAKRYTLQAFRASDTQLGKGAFFAPSESTLLSYKALAEQSIAEVNMKF